MHATHISSTSATYRAGIDLWMVGSKLKITKGAAELNPYLGAERVYSSRSSESTNV